LEIDPFLRPILELGCPVVKKELLKNDGLICNVQGITATYRFCPAQKILKTI
jgi:hypothetical protein